MLFFSDHDIMSSGHFLPPNTKVQFSLTRSSDQFVILSDKDEEKYKLQILSICLYVPVGVMSTKMTQELMMKWTHTDIQYFYDRLDVKVLSMPSNKQEYLSDALFSEFEHPSRVYIMLVETQAVLGNYKLSPYHFGRKWTVVTTASSLTQINYDNVERLSLITAFEQLRDQVAHLVANNGKKKYKMKRKVTRVSLSHCQKKKSENVQQPGSKVAPKKNNQKKKPQSPKLQLLRQLLQLLLQLQLVLIGDFLANIHKLMLYKLLLTIGPKQVPAHLKFWMDLEHLVSKTVLCPLQNQNQ